MMLQKVSLTQLLGNIGFKMKYFSNAIAIRLMRPYQKYIDLRGISRVKHNIFLHLTKDGLRQDYYPQFLSPELQSLAHGITQHIRQTGITPEKLWIVFDDRWKAYFDQVYHHHFDLLGSGWKKCSYSTSSKRSHQATTLIRRIRYKMIDLLTNICDQTSASFEEKDQELIKLIETYDPIDWHIDLRSGFRWPPPVWYKSIRPPLDTGADIKTPGELSRFQHSPVLGMAFQAQQLLDTDTLEQLGLKGKQVDAEWILEVLDWIASNPLNCTIAWRTALVSGIRCVNWIWGISLIQDSPFLTPIVRQIIARSIYEHALHIQSNLGRKKGETNNHYLGHIVCLMYIYYAYPEFPDSDDWILFCLHELLDEIKNTVYEDGGNFEASSHYHRFVTEMFLHGTSLGLRISPTRRDRLRNYAMQLGRKWNGYILPQKEELSIRKTDIFPDWYFSRLYKMLLFTANITTPSGLVPIVGDADNGRFVKITPIGQLSSQNNLFDEEFRDHRHLLAVGGRLFGDIDFGAWGRAYHMDAVALLPMGISLTCAEKVRCEVQSIDRQAFDFFRTPSGHCVYKETGIVLFKDEMMWLLITCGKTGRNGLGGHSHNDVLSFELHLCGIPVIVDPGSFVYTSDIDARNTYRASRNHNTLWNEDLEQHLLLPGPKGVFQLKEKANAKINHTSEASFEGEHQGFGPVHRRNFRIEHRSIYIDDYFRGLANGYLTLILAPSIELQRESQNLSLRFFGRRVLDVHTKGLSYNVEEFFYAKKYGYRERCLKLCFTRSCEETSLVLDYSRCEIVDFKVSG